MYLHSQITPRLDDIFQVVSLACLITLLIGLSACGGGDDSNNLNNPATYIGGSGLAVDRTSVSSIVDNNSSDTDSFSASWTSAEVTHIVVDMPPGITQPAWLNLSVIDNTSPATISLEFNSSVLPVGSYETSVRVETFKDQTPMDFSDISVKLEVVERPVASPNSLIFNMVEGIFPAPQTVTLSRTGSNVTIYDTTSFAFNKGMDYTINGENINVTMNSSVQSLTLGTYNSSLEIDYNGGHWSIPITINVLNTLPKYTVNMAMNANTPLAGELVINNASISRISVDIDDGENSWTLEFPGYNTNLPYVYPVVGFRPNRSHAITVRTFNSLGEQLAVEQANTVVTGALPVGFPTISVVSDPSKMEPGFTLFNILPQLDNDPSTQSASEAFGAALVIVDDKGEVVWYHRGTGFFDIRQLPNKNIVFMQGYKIIEIDMLGNIVHEWADISDASSGARIVDANRFHHEIFPMDNGNFLVLSAEARQLPNYPTSVYPSLSTPATTDTTVVGDVIVEFDPLGKMVSRWYLLDMLDPYRLGYGSLGGYWKGTFGELSKDWSHANAVVHDTTDDSIIVSVRHQDAIMKFNRAATGDVRDVRDVRWILAPPENWSESYKPLLLKPTNPQEFFYSYHQHAPMVLPNGNILVYDNGSFRTSPNINDSGNPQTFSRAVEYKIDIAKMTATLEWEYGGKVQGEANWNYSGALGDADLLAQTGNVLITHGSMIDGSGKFWSRIVEVTHTVPTIAPEIEVFDMVITGSTADLYDGWRVYRSDRIDLY